MNKHGDWLEDFIIFEKTTKDLSALTLRAYKSDTKAFLAFFEKQRAKKVDRDIVYRYFEEMMNEKRQKASTIRRKMASLSSFFDYLECHKIIKSNPMDTIHFSLRKERRLPRVLTVLEAKRLLSSVQSFSATTPYAIFKKKRDLALLDLLISTGVRIDEASKITLQDIDQSNRSIIIHGKGKKERMIYISCIETWHSILDCLRSSLALPYLFSNKNGTRLSTHAIENIYTFYRNSAKINHCSTPHWLRHTFATELLANGADIRSVQELLGHSSVSTTEIYTEVVSKRKKEVMRKYNYRNKIAIIAKTD